MKRHFLSLNALVVIAFIAMAVINKPSSSGAPSASTGAPEEQNCSMSGCHDDNSINSGSANFELEIPGTAKGGELVPIKIKMHDPGKIRFGFQITVLDESNKKVGDFLITDSVRTQIIGGKVDLPERNYLTYTYYGTLGNKAGEMEWNALWRSPDIKGKVTFYAAAISANNDGGDKGDMVYTVAKSVMVEGVLNTVRHVKKKEIQLSISGCDVSINNPHHSFIRSISVVDMSGKELNFIRVQNSGILHKISIPENFAGIAVIKVYTDAGNVVKKCFVSNEGF